MKIVVLDGYTLNPGDLSWDDRESTYKVVFIAGNEPFTQGRVDARSACKEALTKNIIINTIHCGSRQEGIDGSWHDGAALAGGDFLVIDQDKAVAHVDAPQDKRISELSHKLNGTYLGYGERRVEAAGWRFRFPIRVLASRQSSSRILFLTLFNPYAFYGPSSCSPHSEASPEWPQTHHRGGQHWHHSALSVSPRPRAYDGVASD